ncbi:M20/M25/M40 family metallo-hydrolase [Microvirga sp. STR05]|uniref:M20/M25/M40 family metallo-hydrolase n=1 Tax=Hymenobacter duratus TaxID=2771356 RepID=A0ABR8JDZ4_9BACT|nr:M20/M25/M40 family metallo-hydrolase [Hymenobacter duratus]MBD2715069.1 M20/M25/M40 family metallo-hydrolase [Hymenobacter duratus]MBR7949975.1 M20/M25/M40 family metallo-hydrolase [Microvirga sp. STR05]
MRKFPLFVLSLVFCSLSLHAQKKPKSVPNTPGVSAATVERVVKTLASDELKGRASGKPGGLKAAQYLASEFQRLELGMFPGLTSYEQVFPAYESKVAALFVMLHSIPVVKEKVILNSSQPHLNWTDEDEPATRTLVVGPQDKLQPHIRDIMRPRENLVVVLDPVHEKDFKRVAEYLSHGGLRLDKAGNPFSSLVVLAPAPADGKVKFRVAGNTTLRTVELRNVVAVLPGKDPAYATEQVLFSAHYDHIGVLPAVAGDSIANGADDDASGTAAVVALAEYFKKKNDNARTLVFVAFAAEEIGGFGSQYFSRQLTADKVVAMFNIEMIGKPAKFGPNTAFITGFERSDFGKLLQTNLTGTPFRFEADPYPEQNLFYRSDNATLARLGVPAHSISTDQIPTDKLYHSVDDEVESLDLPNMTAVVTAIGRSAAGIVAGQQTPTRIAPESVAPQKP